MNLNFDDCFIVVVFGVDGIVVVVFDVIEVLVEDWVVSLWNLFEVCWVVGVVYVVSWLVVIVSYFLYCFFNWWLVFGNLVLIFGYVE